MTDELRKSIDDVTVTENEYPHYENMNGLVEGKIPMGVQCPFKENCRYVTKCERPKVMKIDFSCALARAFSLTENKEN